MNQAVLRSHVEERIADAEALLAAGRWNFAYYVAGYAVECALKSCVLARMIETGWVFDENNKRIDECRTHDWGKLVDIAGLKDDLNSKMRESAESSGQFHLNWNLASGWSVTSRYQTCTKEAAEALLKAITDETHGVLSWVKIHW